MQVTILGCGYVGRAVAQRWRQQGLIVTATTTRPARIPELTELADRAVVVRGDDAASLQPLLADQSVLLVSVGASSAASYRDDYLTTAKTLVSVLPQTSVYQVIYTSSCGVYGDHEGQWVTEESPLYPATENSKILAATEQVWLNARSDHLKVCVLRLGGIYGPGRELTRIFARAFGNPRAGTGTEVSNWVHLDDIVAGIDFARRHQLDGLYNLVQTEPISSGELLNRLSRTYDLPAVQWNPDQPSARSYHARISNQKLRSAGFEVQHPVLILE